MSTREALLRRIERLAGEREELLDRLLSLEPARISTPPAPGVWSAAQVVEHMIIAEHYCLLGHLPPDQLRVRSASLRQRLLYELVVLILTSPIRVSAPVQDMDPEGSTPLGELAPRWRTSQERLADIVRTVDDPVRDAVFRHPVAGPMTPAQAVRMLEAHQRRHTRQIDERLAELT